MELKVTDHAHIKRDLRRARHIQTSSLRAQEWQVPSARNGAALPSVTRSRRASGKRTSRGGFEQDLCYLPS